MSSLAQGGQAAIFKLSFWNYYPSQWGLVLRNLSMENKAYNPILFLISQK